MNPLFFGGLKFMIKNTSAMTVFQFERVVYHACMLLLVP